MEPHYFRSPAGLRRWFAQHGASERELWVGFVKRGRPGSGLSWPESVDEALCVGWIDGVRKRVDEERYAIRFSPRKPTSIWSAVNIRRARLERLIAQWSRGEVGRELVLRPRQA